MEVCVRQAFVKDKEAIWKFIEDAYEEDDKGSSKYKIHQRWIWQFLENPFLRENKDRLPIWIALKNNEIVGQYCAIPVNIKLGDQIFHAAWGCDFIVSGEHRGEGVGFKLNKALYNHYPVTMAISMSKSTMKIWEKSGSIDVTSVDTYWYFIKFDKELVYNYLMKRSKRQHTINMIIYVACRICYMHNVFTLIANPILRFGKMINVGLKEKPDCEIKEIFEFDKENDIFSDDTVAEYDAIVKRESKLLNWKYFSNRQLQYRAFVATKNGSRTGYIVIRKPHPAEFPFGIISDIYAAKNSLNTINSLISHAMCVFGNTVSAIQCITSVDEHKKVLRNLGFIRTESNKLKVLFSDQSIRDVIFKKSKKDWYITAMDQDLDQVRPI